MIGEASTGGGRAVEAQAQGVIARAEDRAVGALHLDVILLAGDGVGDGHVEGRAVLVEPAGRADHRGHVGGIDGDLGREQAQARALDRDLHRAAGPRRRVHAEVFRIADLGEVEVVRQAGERVAVDQAVQVRRRGERGVGAAVGIGPPAPP